MICDYSKNQEASQLWHWAWRGRCLGQSFLLKWAKLGWSGPEGVHYGPAGGEVSGAAVQWFRLHYIDGLQLLNLPWPSAGSNVGHWGGSRMKRVYQKDERRRFIWTSAAEAAFEAAAMNGFLLPLIGELRLNLVLKPPKKDALRQT